MSTPDPTPDVDAGADEPLVVHLHINSFTAPERRALQRRFGLNFDTLADYLWRGLFAPDVDPASLEPMRAPGQKVRAVGDDGVEWVVATYGEPVFVDEVLAEFLTTVRRRTDPEAKVEDLDGYGCQDLAGSVLRGAAANPKAKT